MHGRGNRCKADADAPLYPVNSLSRRAERAAPLPASLTSCDGGKVEGLA